MSAPADYDVVINALEESREILRGHIDPGPRTSKRTIKALLEILDDASVVGALDRLLQRRSVRLIEAIDRECHGCG